MLLPQEVPDSAKYKLPASVGLVPFAFVIVISPFTFNSVVGLVVPIPTRLLTLSNLTLTPLVTLPI